MLKFFQKLLRPKTMIEETPVEPQTLKFEMDDFVRETLCKKSKDEIDDFMFKEYKILLKIKEFNSEIMYVLKQTSDRYNYKFQAPEVKVYLSSVICMCIFLKKKKIEAEHWLSYLNLQ